jgi:hypothetical protein
VLQGGPHLLPGFDPGLVGVLMQRFRKLIHTNAGMQAIAFRRSRPLWMAMPAARKSRLARSVGHRHTPPCRHPCHGDPLQTTGGTNAGHRLRLSDGLGRPQLRLCVEISASRWLLVR